MRARTSPRPIRTGSGWARFDEHPLGAVAIGTLLALASLAAMGGGSAAGAESLHALHSGTSHGSVTRVSAAREAAVRRAAVPPLDRAATGGPRVISTLALLNNTLDPGLNTSSNNGISPMGGAYDPATGNLYVTTGISSLEEIVNATNGRLLGSFFAGVGAEAVAIDPTSGDAYTADAGVFTYPNGTGIAPVELSGITVSNVSTGSTITTVPDPGAPSDIVYAASSQLVFAADSVSGNATYGNVTIVSATNNTVIRTAAVGASPVALVYDPAADLVAVANQASNNLSLLNASNGRLVATVAVGGAPSSVALAPTSGLLYVANVGTDNVSVVNVTSRSVSATISLPFAPRAVAWAAGSLYLSDVAASALYVVNATTGAHSVTLASGALVYRILYVSAVGRVFASSEAGENVSIVDAATATEAGSVRLGESPTGVAEDPTTGVLAVAIANAGLLELVSPATGLGFATVPVVGNPLGAMQVAFDAWNGCFYVVDQSDATVTVVSEAQRSVVTTVALEGPASGIAFDPTTGSLLVALASPNQTGANLVQVIDGATNMITRTFVVTNYLALGPIAYDPYDNEAYVSIAGYIGSFNALIAVNASNGAPAGSTNVQQGAQAGIAVDPARGTVFVAATNFSASDVEAVNGTSHAVLWATNITAFEFQPSGIAFDPATDTVWVGDAALGNVTVLNASTGAVVSVFAAGFESYQLAYASGTSTVFSTDPFLGILVDISDGSPARYAVTFSESGLPTGTPWSVVLNGTSHTSTTPAIDFEEPNGSYAYAAAAPGYTAVRGGSLGFTVSGDGAAFDVAFVANGSEFPLTFTEAGLPSGTNWSVSVAGTGAFSGWANNSSTTSIVALVAPLGFTGVYTVGAVPGYTAVPASGTVDTSPTGAAKNVEVRFSSSTSPTISSFAAAPATVGVGNATTFSVAASGGAPPLSYAYRGLPAGCSSENSSTLPCTPTTVGQSTVEVTVTDAHGRSAYANATLTVTGPLATSPTHSFLGLPYAEGIALSSGIALVVIVGGVLILLRRRQPPAAEPPSERR